MLTRVLVLLMSAYLEPTLRMMVAPMTDISLLTANVVWTDRYLKDTYASLVLCSMSCGPIKKVHLKMITDLMKCPGRRSALTLIGTTSPVPLLCMGSLRSKCHTMTVTNQLFSILVQNIRDLNSMIRESSNTQRLKILIVNGIVYQYSTWFHTIP